MKECPVCALLDGLTCARCEVELAQAVLDAALAWEAKLEGLVGSGQFARAWARMGADEVHLYNAIRAYRAAKETP